MLVIFRPHEKLRTRPIKPNPNSTASITDEGSSSMSFFIRLDKSEFTPETLLSGFSIAPPPICVLSVDYDSAKDIYTYEFNPKQFVLWSPDDVIRFVLDNKIPSSADMRLHKHCCTDINSTQLVKQNDHTSPASPAEVYHANAQSTQMKVKLDSRQLVHIGLIVQITAKPGSGLKSDFLLCDPQVGSGPPL